MAKMAKAVGFGSNVPSVQMANPAPVEHGGEAAPATPIGPGVPAQGSDLWQANEDRDLELPERRLFRRRGRKYVGSHRPQAARRAGRAERKRRAGRAKSRPDYGFES
jgi:hypothetical protein